MPVTVWQFAIAFVVLVVVLNVIAARRRKARSEETHSFAALHGFLSEGDANPFVGAEVNRVQRPVGIGTAPIEPQAMFDLAAGRGIVRNVMRGSTAAGEVVVLDYRPPAGARTGHSTMFSTLAIFRVAGLSEFHLVRRFGFAIGIKTVEFPSHPRFTRRFRLMANDETAMRETFSAEVLAACESLGDKREWALQAGSSWLLAGFGQARAEELPQLVHESARVAAALQLAIR